MVDTNEDSKDFNAANVSLNVEIATKALKKILKTFIGRENTPRNRDKIKKKIDKYLEKLTHASEKERTAVGEMVYNRFIEMNDKSCEYSNKLTELRTKFRKERENKDKEEKPEIVIPPYQPESPPWGG